LSASSRARAVGASQMKIEPRLLRRHDSFVDAASELEALRQTLDSAPGVVSISSFEPHRKGGHRVSMEVERESLDAFIAYLYAEGWMDGF